MLSRKRVPGKCGTCSGRGCSYCNDMTEGDSITGALAEFRKRMGDTSDPVYRNMCGQMIINLRRAKIMLKLPPQGVDSKTR
jgi:radical SAM superfamily enzyme